MPTLTAAYQTDIGLVRKMNQDSVVVLSAEDLECRLDGLYVVADGMGGKAGGEIASKVTVETVPAVVEEVLAEHTEPTGPTALAEALREGLEAANDAVYTQARANPELRGMGTTCIAVLIRDGQAVIGNVGDSRIYLLRHGKLMQLTSDHSLVQEHVRSGELTQEQARGSRFKNVITRAIGIARNVSPDIELVQLQPSDTLLLCSDGLTNMVDEDEIGRIVGANEDVEEICRQLVDAAKSNGGIDNITTVVVRHGPYMPAPVTRTVPVAKLYTDSFDDDEDDYDERPAVNKRPTYSKPVSLSTGKIAQWTLIAVLAIGLFVVGKEVYEFVPAWPFLQHKPAPAPTTAPVPPPATDYAKLTYADPVQLLDKPLRGAPIAVDAAGNVFAVSIPGTTVRISPTGVATAFPPAEVQPKRVDAGKYWATDPQGNLYVSSSVDKMITKYDSKGARLGKLGENHLKAPDGLAVDSKGNVYVIDGNRLKVLRAQAASPTPAPASTSSQHLSAEADPSSPARPDHGTR